VSSWLDRNLPELADDETGRPARNVQYGWPIWQMYIARAGEVNRALHNPERSVPESA
jgi:hypothetical protein